jgi:hypothetical protein
MGNRLPLKFQLLRICSPVSLFLLVLIYCPFSWAGQDAIVMVDKAVIFADEKMSAPVGYVRRGKKIKVGDVARFKAQVYPIIVSGRVAYIRVIDVSTEKESVDSAVLVAERFQQTTKEEQQTNYSVSFFNHSSQVSLGKQNDRLKNNDSVDWYGVSIRGGAKISQKWDLDILLNILNGKAEREVFRTVEFGVGGALRVFEKSHFQLRALAQFLAVPFSTYAVGDDFRVNGYGFTTGGAISATYLLGKNFGVEGYGGFYYTKLSGFKSPAPYSEIAPSFIGTRIGAGINYQF